MKKLITIIGLLFMIIGCASHEQASLSSFEKSFDEVFPKDFKPTCIEGIVNEGTPREDAEKYCDCIISYIINNFSASEKLNLPEYNSNEIYDYCTRNVNN